MKPRETYLGFKTTLFAKQLLRWSGKWTQLKSNTLYFIASHFNSWFYIINYLHHICLHKHTPTHRETLFSLLAKRDDMFFSLFSRNPTLQEIQHTRKLLYPTYLGKKTVWDLLLFNLLSINKWLTHHFTLKCYLILSTNNTICNRSLQPLTAACILRKITIKWATANRITNRHMHAT